MATKSVSYRNGRGYTATLYTVLGVETWANTRVTDLPDPSGFEGQEQAQNGPQRLAGEFNDLGNARVAIPQDDDQAEGARIGNTVGSLVLQKSGEKTRAYVGHCIKDGGAVIDPEAPNGQRRAVEIACHQRAIIITETLAFTQNVAASGQGLVAAGKKNDGTTESIVFALDTGETMPTGLTLGSGGGITGTPTGSGTSTVVVKGTTSSGVFKMPISIVITAAG
jgi:hypothetical protein